MRLIFAMIAKMALKLRLKMNKQDVYKRTMEFCIAEDKYGLLRDGENKILYFIKRMYYKLKGLL